MIPLQCSAVLLLLIDVPLNSPDSIYSREDSPAASLYMVSIVEWSKSSRLKVRNQPPQICNNIYSLNIMINCTISPSTAWIKIRVHNA